jgi:hypothetical protein
MPDRGRKFLGISVRRWINYSAAILVGNAIYYFRCSRIFRLRFDLGNFFCMGAARSILSCAERRLDDPAWLKSMIWCAPCN